MMKTFGVMVMAAGVFCAVASGPVDARSWRDIGGAIVYPAKKAVKNGGHNAKHVAGDPNRRRRHAQAHGRGHSSHKRHHH